jgi:hypothetical protein
MFGLGHQGLIIALVIVLVLFASTKLPALARGLGEVLRDSGHGRLPERRAVRPRDGTTGGRPRNLTLTHLATWLAVACVAAGIAALFRLV